PRILPLAVGAGPHDGHAGHGVPGAEPAHRGGARRMAPGRTVVRAGLVGGRLGPARRVAGPQANARGALAVDDVVGWSVVKVDYAVRNDVPVATNIDVIRHAGQ